MHGFWIDTAPWIVYGIFAFLFLCTVAFIVIVALDLRESGNAQRPPHHETARSGHVSQRPGQHPPLAGRRDIHIERIVADSSRPGLHHVLNVEPMDPRS